MDGGEMIDADFVVLGLGSVPRTERLEGSGPDVTDGVLCDTTCHAVDLIGRQVPDIVAAGDVARWPNEWFDSTPRRVEHLVHAVEMGNTLPAPRSGARRGRDVHPSATTAHPRLLSASPPTATVLALLMTRRLRERLPHAREHDYPSAADCTHPPCHALRNGRYRRCSRTGPVRLFIVRVDGIHRDGNRRRPHSRRHGFLSVR